MNANNFTYSGSFADLALGQQLATAMYDSGVDAIFAAAGGTGVGVINEAKNRRLSGEDVWAIGVDVDQYSVGDMGNGESCILTSAMIRPGFRRSQGNLPGRSPHRAGRLRRKSGNPCIQPEPHS